MSDFPTHHLMHYLVNSKKCNSAFSASFTTFHSINYCRIENSDNKPMPDRPKYLLSEFKNIK